MNIPSAHDNAVLVAPRPVRLAAPFSQFSPSFLHRPQSSKAAVRLVAAPTDAFERLKVSSDSYSSEEDLVSPSAERDRPISPRPSPLSTLPSEAVEEFLSILRPAAILFPPTSPILRSSNGTTAHGFVPYRRPQSCGLSPAMSNEGLGLTLADQNDNASKENELFVYPFRLLGSGHLSSPISRTHTRNPFPRHPAFDGPVSTFITQHSTSNTPSPVPMALSPAAVPLPLPTPDETDLELA